MWTWAHTAQPRENPNLHSLPLFQSLLNYISLHFIFPLDLGSPHGIKALKLSWAISILLLPHCSSQYPTNPFSSQDFKPSTNWLHRSVTDLKIRNTQLFQSPSTPSCTATRSKRLQLPHSCVVVHHAPDLHLIAIDSSGDHLQSIDQKSIYSKPKKSVQLEYAIAAMRWLKFQQSEPCSSRASHTLHQSVCATSTLMMWSWWCHLVWNCDSPNPLTRSDPILLIFYLKKIQISKIWKLKKKKIQKTGSDQWEKKKKSNFEFQNLKIQKKKKRN